MKFDLKTFVTVCMTIALIVFTYLKIIGNELFISTCGAVFAYYFNKDMKRSEVNENKQENLNGEQDVIDE